MLDWLSKSRADHKKAPLKYHVDPRIRALGKARIDVTQRAANEEDWQRMWREPRFTFPFEWGSGWRSAFHYYVADFAAEIGFFIDVLGLPVMAFSPSFAQFSEPDGEFLFSVTGVAEGMLATPPDTLRMQFSVKNYSAVLGELTKRGIQFENGPEAEEAVLPAVFRTPHGIAIELWPAPGVDAPAQSFQVAQDSLAAFWETGAEDDLEDETFEANPVIATPDPVTLNDEEEEVDFADAVTAELEDDESVVYEDLPDTDDEPQDLVYEDDDEAAEPSQPQIPPERARLASIPPSPPLKTNRTRSLEIPLKDGVMIRTGKTRTQRPPLYPFRDD